MTENQETTNDMGFLESKIIRVAMVLLAMLLVFAGPTYVPYVLTDIVLLDATVSILVGLVLFIAGIALIVYLIRKKAIT